MIGKKKINKKCVKLTLSVNLKIHYKDKINNIRNKEKWLFFSLYIIKLYIKYLKKCLNFIKNFYILPYKKVNKC